MSNIDHTEQVPQRGVYLCQTKSRTNKTLMFSGIHKNDGEEAVRKRDGAWSILEMSW